MKKFLAICTLFITAAVFGKEFSPVHAQNVRTITIAAADDTLTNADTALVTIPVVNSTVSATAVVNKISGTVGGKVYLEATVDGITYDKLDSLTLANQAINNKTFNPRASNGKLLYATYRFDFILSGTQSSAPKAYMTKRED